MVIIPRKNRQKQREQKWQDKIEDVDVIIFGKGVKDKVTIYMSCLVDGGQDKIKYE